MPWTLAIGRKETTEVAGIEDSPRASFSAAVSQVPR